MEYFWLTGKEYKEETCKKGKTAGISNEALGYMFIRVHLVCPSYIKRHINPLKTSPEYTRAGVYGKCVL